LATASSEKSSLVSAKELASKLKVTDALVKKLVKDFGLDSEKVKNRTHLPPKSIDVLKKILKLKDEGKKPKEIKALLESAKPAKSEKAAEEKPKSKSRKTETSGKKEKKSEKKEEKKEEAKKDFKSKKKFEKKKPKKEELKKEEKKDTEPDYKEYVKDEASEHEHLELENKVLEDLQDDIDAELDDEDIEEIEEVEESPKASHDSPYGRQKKVRRKKFNFRYVQRQIANDSKHIRYLQHRLKRTNLSTLERVTLEGNLDKRSRLLNGWLHILRWIKSN